MRPPGSAGKPHPGSKPRASAQVSADRQKTPSVLVLTSDALFSHFFSEATLERLSSVASWRQSTERVDTAQLRQMIADVDALVTTWHSPFITVPMLGRTPRVRLIAHCGGEVKSRMEEQVIDIVTVTNAPDPMAAPVAEMALAMMLSLVRRLPDYDRRMRAGEMVDNRRAAEGETLAGRKVGIIGFGRIGRALARLLGPFQVELLVADPFCSMEDAADLSVKRVDLAELVRSCSVVVLAAGLTEQTRGLLDARLFGLMPDGAYFVNVARGGLVEMRALLSELRSGRISAALDVTDPLEPLPGDHELRRLPNVILTPHVAAGGVEVRRAMGAVAVESVAAFFSGRIPANIVTREMLSKMT
jgi:phosphoglycerate dehydrogenase-like enzyme